MRLRHLSLYVHLLEVFSKTDISACLLTLYLLKVSKRISADSPKKFEIEVWRRTEAGKEDAATILFGISAYFPRYSVVLPSRPRISDSTIGSTSSYLIRHPGSFQLQVKRVKLSLHFSTFPMNMKSHAKHQAGRRQSRIKWRYMMYMSSPKFIYYFSNDTRQFPIYRMNSNLVLKSRASPWPLVGAPAIMGMD